MATTPIRLTPPPPGSLCSRDEIRLRSGTHIPSSYLSTLQFLDKDTGVGVTASQISCALPDGESSLESFPVWLVISRDGGGVWRTSGSPLPRVLESGLVGAEMAFSSAEQGWLEANGRIGFTSDGGHHWRVFGLEDVTALSPWDGGVDALVNQSGTRGARVLKLSEGGTVAGATPPLPLAVGLLRATVQYMAVVPRSGLIFVEVPGLPHDRAFSTGGKGQRWVPEPAPCPGVPGLGQVIAVGGLLAAECNLGSSMNSNAKAFVISADAGRTWALQAAWRNLEAPNPSALPTADFFSLGASSVSMFWMATDLGASVSRDGGSRWRPIDLRRGKSVFRSELFFQNSFGAEFFFVDPRHGWLLLPGEALFVTDNGWVWKPA